MFFFSESTAYGFLCFIPKVRSVHSKLICSVVFLKKKVKT